MPDDITEAELTLLRHLQERAGVSGGRVGLDPRAVMRVLRLSATQLAEDAAALAAHGLAGVRHARGGADGDVPSPACTAVWVTSKGEAYLKRLGRRRAAATPDGWVGRALPADATE